jgi:transposase-like protein
MKFRVSSGILAQKMLTLAATALLIQQMGIFPSEGECKGCEAVIVDEYKKSGNFFYWLCLECKMKTPLRYNTVLSNSNTRMDRFVLLMWNFCEKAKTYDQIVNDVCLPSDNYKDEMMSHETINKWNKYFRHIVCQEMKDQMDKIGGGNFIIEIDESMFGKCKYGKGNRAKRRRQWVFGGVCRETGRCFVKLCPQNKRTKKALYPIIQANIKRGSMIYSDGWRAYRKIPTLGYRHRWIDHSKYYVHPDDPTLHTNQIEGLWRCIKRWLPSSGRYNLEQHLMVYQWFNMHQHAGTDPFWALVDLVKKNNSAEVMKAAQKVEQDTEGRVYDEEKERAEQEEADENESDTEDSDSETDDSESEMVIFPCPFCSRVFGSKDETLNHIEKCRQKLM